MYCDSTPKLKILFRLSKREAKLKVIKEFGEKFTKFTNFPKFSINS